MPYSTYFWSVLLFLMVTGAILYVVDRAVGVRLRQFIWGLTHDKRTKLPDSMKVGFIYGRHVKTRVKVAAAIMLVETALTIMFRAGVNPFVELISAVVDIPVLLLGFYMGPLLETVLGFVGVTLDRVEEVEKRIERGETSLGTEFSSVVDDARLRVRARVDEFAGIPTVPPTSTSTQPPAAPPAPAEPEPDPVAGLDSFLGRSNSRREN